MAELGIVSSVAGLLSLGITVCKGILVYYDQYKGQQDDIDIMCASVERVGKILLAISSLITGRKYTQSVVDIVNSSIAACQQGLDDLSKKLGKIRTLPPDKTLDTKFANMKRKLKYPLRQSTLLKLREICDDMKDNLDLALAALNMYAFLDFSACQEDQRLTDSSDATIIAQQRLDALTDASSVVTKSIGSIETRVSEITVGVGTLLSEHEGAYKITDFHDIDLRPRRCDFG